MATNKHPDTPAQRERTTITLDVQELAAGVARLGADVAPPAGEVSGADVAPLGKAGFPPADVDRGASGVPLTDTTQEGPDQAEAADGNVSPPSAATAAAAAEGVVETATETAHVVPAPSAEVPVAEASAAAMSSTPASSAPATPPDVVASPSVPEPADPGATKEMPIAPVAEREARLEPVPAFADEAQSDVEAEWSMADKPTVFLPPMARSNRPAFLETGEIPAWPPRPGPAANPAANPLANPAANPAARPGGLSRPMTPPPAGPMSRPLTPPPGGPMSRQFNPTVPMSRPLTPPGTGPMSRPMTPRPGVTGQPAMGQPPAGYGPASRPLTPPPTRQMAGPGVPGGAAPTGAPFGAPTAPPAGPQASPPTNTLRSMMRPAPGQERIPSPTGRPAAGTWPANSDPRIRRLEELRRQRLAQIAGEHGEGVPVAQMVRQWWNDLVPGMRNALHSQHEARASGVYPMPATETATTGRLGDAFGRLSAAVRDMSERAQSATGPTLKGIHERAEHAAQAIVERFEGSPARQQAPLLGPGRLAVFFRQGVTVGDAQRLLVATRARPMRLIPRRHGFLALVPPGNESSIGEQLRQHPYVRDVVYLEYDALGQALPPR